MQGSYRKKYQFFITYMNAVKASAASKPLSDSRKTLSESGYEDHSLSFDINSKNLSYYSSVLSKFIKFFIRLRSGSIVATQYPVPTVGYLLIFFIKLAALRKIKFITIIHDINSLRSNKLNAAELRKEIKILSAYQGLIVHNDVMKEWLINNGLKSSSIMIPLNFFDYISSSEVYSNPVPTANTHTIAFAGHLAKSIFVYDLGRVKNYQFNIYGSDFDQNKSQHVNTTWKGEYSPDELVYNLEGSFGLVWDGADSTNISTNTFGNYMRYNNPFKFSLYIAAGLPVIAPTDAAIAKTITDNNIGFLIDNLDDLNNISITDQEYQTMKKNVKEIQKDIVAGNYLRKAVHNLEQVI